MKNGITIFLIGLLFYSSCKKTEITNGTPLCIKTEIRNYEVNGTFCSDAHVDEYEFQSERVYFFSPGTCGNDMAAEVFDSKCNSIGFIGGLLGNTQINGEEFSNAKFIKTVWKK